MNQKHPPTPVRIVILGGGYVAVWAYRSILRRLRQEIRQGQVELIVIGPESYHSFHGWTGEVLGGVIALPNRFSSLRSLLRHARLVRGSAMRIDLNTQTVQVRLEGSGQQTEVGYDHLLIGVGSRDFVESIPGVRRHGWWLKGTGDLLALRNHLLTVIEQADSIADPALRAHLLSFVVAGGGFAGVEMCAAIAEMLQVMRRTHPVLREQPPQITLVHSGRTLLPQLRPRYAKMAEYATRQLTAYGVKLRLGARLAEVQPEGALLSDGSMISARTVISTVGQALIPLAGTETLARDQQGRLLTDAYLHVQQYENVWTGGDVANVVHARTQTPCPANALWAIKHGERVGDNIARAVISKPLKPFTYPGLGQAASMGIGKGMTELYGLQFTGWIGWVFRLFFFLYFMPSRAQAVRVAFDWLTLPVFGRHLLPLDYPTAASGVAYSVDVPVDTRVPEPVTTLV